MNLNWLQDTDFVGFLSGLKITHCANILAPAVVVQQQNYNVYKSHDSGISSNGFYNSPVNSKLQRGEGDGEEYASTTLPKLYEKYPLEPPELPPRDYTTDEDALEGTKSQNLTWKRAKKSKMHRHFRWIRNRRDQIRRIQRPARPIDHVQNRLQSGPAIANRQKRTRVQSGGRLQRGHNGGQAQLGLWQKWIRHRWRR